MYSLAARTGLRAAAAARPQPLILRNAVARRMEHSASDADRSQSRNSLQQGAKRDPELYVCTPLHSHYGDGRPEGIGD